MEERRRPLDCKCNEDEFFFEGSVYTYDWTLTLAPCSTNSFTTSSCPAVQREREKKKKTNEVCTWWAIKVIFIEQSRPSHSIVSYYNMSLAQINCLTGFLYIITQGHIAKVSSNDGNSLRLHLSQTWFSIWHTYFLPHTWGRLPLAREILLIGKGADANYFSTFLTHSHIHMLTICTH